MFDCPMNSNGCWRGICRTAHPENFPFPVCKGMSKGKRVCPDYQEWLKCIEENYPDPEECGDWCKGYDYCKRYKEESNDNQ